MHSFISVYIHCVWSTKNRAPSLHSNVRDRLWPYLGGIARENKMKALAIGGAADHVHILFSLAATTSISKSGATSQRQFLEMDPRYVSRNTFV